MYACAQHVVVARARRQMPFHREHHAWPYVPFHKLPAANALVRDALAAAATAPGNAAAAALGLALSAQHRQQLHVQQLRD